MRPFGIRLGMLWALFVACVRMFVRNRAAVFFSCANPIRSPRTWCRSSPAPNHHMTGSLQNIALRSSGVLVK